MEKEKKEKEEEEEKSNGKVGTRWVRQKENKMSKKVEVPPLSSHHYHQNYHHCYYNYHPYCHWYFFCHSRKIKNRTTLIGGWWTGPSVLRNLNPGIFGTGFLQNPGIPGFSGTGLTYFFHPGIDGIPGFFGTGLA